MNEDRRRALNAAAAQLLLTHGMEIASALCRYPTDTPAAKAFRAVRDWMIGYQGAVDYAEIVEGTRRIGAELDAASRERALNASVKWKP